MTHKLFLFNIYQIGSNSTLPVTINSIRIIGAERTRQGFLDRIFNPLLSANKDRPYTLTEALQALGSSGDRLRKFGEHSATFIIPED